MRSDTGPDRLLPHDLESERAVLGAILLDADAYHTAAATLSAGDFYLEAHRSIFAAMTELAEAGAYEAADSAGTIIGGLEDELLKLGLTASRSGFRPGNLVIVAARPGLGKTSLCLNIAAHAALRLGKRVAIFSLEMSEADGPPRTRASRS